MLPLKEPLKELPADRVEAVGEAIAGTCEDQPVAVEDTAGDFPAVALAISYAIAGAANALGTWVPVYCAGIETIDTPTWLMVCRDRPTPLTGKACTNSGLKP
jgi:hypothetical protein